MDKLEIAKKAAGFVVGIGVSRIVAGFIKNNTSPDSVTDKVAIASAALVIGSMASSATKKHTDKLIDDLVTAYKKIEEGVKEKLNSSES